MLRLWNDGWSFLRTEPGTELADIPGREEEFSPVVIPHDWLIGDVRHLYEDGTGWYRKCFMAKEYGCSPGQSVFLRFDGIYMDSTVYVNGVRAGDWKYGYSAFDVSVGEYLKEGENEVLVQVRFLSPNSRWYSGAGIYRNVWIQVCGEAYLPMDGTYVSSVWEESSDEGRSTYSVRIDTECAGHMEPGVLCRYTLYDSGFMPVPVVWKQEKESVSRNADGIMVHHAEAKVPDVKEWDIEHPDCYTLRAALYVGDAPEPADVRDITIGFCRKHFDPERGFFLNGRQVKVHGTCEHHDLGCLGAAFHKEAMRRRLEILKKMGVNALRTAHNMPAPELMDLADEMGFLVVSEAFDMWERPKTRYDYARFFPEWAGRDVRSWIRRDRNHPCVLLWSIGNEIYDTHADERGLLITKRLIGFVREHDPKENAGITIGSNYMPWEGAQKCADLVKFAGYNYGEKYYEKHHEEHPDWVIYGSETGSLVHSRGVYHFPLSQSLLADEDEQCSALGNSRTSWGAKSVEDCIADDRDAGFAFGQFLWTGFDYIGEPTPYHTKNSYFGMVDTAGFPKDAYYVFQAEWTDCRTNPMVHLYPYWDFNEGQLIDVRACTNGDSVELFVNGRSMGRQSLDHRHGRKLLGTWQVPYTPGEILAVAYDREGREIARHGRHSFQDSAALVLSADRTVLKGDGEDLCFLTISAVDAYGYPVENAMDYVKVTVEGCGVLMGLDNGDSTDYDEYRGNVRKLFNGKLLAVVGALTEEGRIKVTAEADGLRGGEVLLKTERCPVREGIGNRKMAWGKWPEGTRQAENCGYGSRIPVRKVELSAADGQLLTPERPEILAEAQIRPFHAQDQELIWKAVNAGGIEVGFASVEKLPAGPAEGPEKGAGRKLPADGAQEGILGKQRVRIRVSGDGSFFLRCMSKSGTDRIRLISQLEFCAKGFGPAYLDPYSFVSAGLYTDSTGEIGNGNEKGITSARDGVSAAVYSGLDFGDYGSDTITMPIFALDDEAHVIEIWLGKPDEPGSRLLKAAVYQKPSIWNVYQEETWKLPERVRGVASLSFRMHEKLHIKGFSFLRYQKAYCYLNAAEYSGIYGDSFRTEKDGIADIGNNVTIEYDHMDFGESGAGCVTIEGRSALARNTIHILFCPEDGGETKRRIVEFAGTDRYEKQTLRIEPLKGSGKLSLVFLPGSRFDLKGFQFHRDSGSENM